MAQPTPESLQAVHVKYVGELQQLESLLPTIKSDYKQAIETTERSRVQLRAAGEAKAKADGQLLALGQRMIAAPDDQRASIDRDIQRAQAVAQSAGAAVEQATASHRQTVDILIQHNKQYLKALEDLDLLKIKDKVTLDALAQNPLPPTIVQDMRNHAERAKDDMKRRHADRRRNMEETIRTLDSAVVLQLVQRDLTAARTATSMSGPGVPGAASDESVAIAQCRASNGNCLGIVQNQDNIIRGLRGEIQNLSAAVKTPMMTPSPQIHPGQLVALQSDLDRIQGENNQMKHTIRDCMIQRKQLETQAVATLSSSMTACRDKSDSLEAKQAEYQMKQASLEQLLESKSSAVQSFDAQIQQLHVQREMALQQDPTVQELRAKGPSAALSLAEERAALQFQNKVAELERARDRITEELSKAHLKLTGIATSMGLLKHKQEELVRHMGAVEHAKYKSRIASLEEQLSRAAGDRKHRSSDVEKRMDAVHREKLDAESSQLRKQYEKVVRQLTKELITAETRLQDVFKKTQASEVMLQESSQRLRELQGRKLAYEDSTNMQYGAVDTSTLQVDMNRSQEEMNKAKFTIGHLLTDRDRLKQESDTLRTLVQKYTQDMAALSDLVKQQSGFHEELIQARKELDVASKTATTLRVELTAANDRLTQVDAVRERLEHELAANPTVDEHKSIQDKLATINEERTAILSKYTAIKASADMCGREHREQGIKIGVLLQAITDTERVKEQMQRLLVEKQQLQEQFDVVKATRSSDEVRAQLKAIDQLYRDSMNRHSSEINGRDRKIQQLADKLREIAGRSGAQQQQQRPTGAVAAKMDAQAKLANQDLKVIDIRSQMYTDAASLVSNELSSSELEAQLTSLRQKAAKAEVAAAREAESLRTRARDAEAQYQSFRRMAHADLDAEDASLLSKMNEVSRVGGDQSQSQLRQLSESYDKSVAARNQLLAQEYADFNHSADLERTRESRLMDAIRPLERLSMSLTMLDVDPRTRRVAEFRDDMQTELKETEAAIDRQRNESESSRRSAGVSKTLQDTLNARYRELRTMLDQASQSSSYHKMLEAATRPESFSLEGALAQNVQQQTRQSMEQVRTTIVLPDLKNVNLKVNPLKQEIRYPGGVAVPSEVAMAPQRALMTTAERIKKQQTLKNDVIIVAYGFAKPDKTEATRYTLFHAAIMNHFEVLKGLFGSPVRVQIVQSDKNAFVLDRLGGMKMSVQNCVFNGPQCTVEGRDMPMLSASGFMDEIKPYISNDKVDASCIVSLSRGGESPRVHFVDLIMVDNVRVMDHAWLNYLAPVIAQPGTLVDLISAIDNDIQNKTVHLARAQSEVYAFIEMMNRGRPRAAI